MIDEDTSAASSPTELGALLIPTLHESFLRQGRILAFPLCYPGATAPPLADESRVRALDVLADGTIYVGTGGYAAHFMVGFFNGVTGAVFDLGTVEGATTTIAICAGDDHIVAVVDGPSGSRLITRPPESHPYDLSQEGGFFPQPLVDLGEPLQGERVIAACRTSDRSALVGASATQVFRLDLHTLERQVVGEVAARSVLIAMPDGSVLGLDDQDSLWRLQPGDEAIERNAISLPPGDWKSVCVAAGEPYVADASGGLYVLGSEPRRVGQAPRTPVTAMAATFDGRLFGFCGEQLETMFQFDPTTGDTSDLGLAASVIQSRRYGWNFSSAVVGREGEIVFGEDDDHGHLWLYFPRVTSRSGVRP